jgi:hypothetical protein
MHTAGHTRVILASLLAAGMAGVPAAQSAPDALAILKKARDAGGGDPAIRALRGVRATGTFWTSQTVVGGYTQDMEDPLEIRVAFPDKYLELTTFGPVHSEHLRGFAGNRVLSSMGGRPSTFPTEEAYVKRRAAEFLMLFLTRHEGWGALTFDMIAPHTLRMRGISPYEARLEFDRTTGLLTTLTYKQRRQVRTPNTIRFRDQPRANTAPAGQGTVSGGSGGSGADLPEVDMIVTVHDRKTVGGVSFPHRITTTANGVVMWELRFKSIVVNPTFAAADFGG